MAAKDRFHGHRRRRSTIHDLSDDLLEVILLRTPSQVALIRAAATCKLWLRVIASAAFLRRFRRLHGPHVLGHYYRWPGFDRPYFDPSPPPAGEAAVVGRDRVSLGFVAASFPVLHDSRCGVLAILGLGRLIVCDPWTRQHRELHPPCLCEKSYNYFCLGVFLLDAADSGETGGSGPMSIYRVLCVNVIRPYDGDSRTVRACVFSARDNRWTVPSRAGAVVADDVPRVQNTSTGEFIFVGRAGGSICWSTRAGDAVLHLDESSGCELSFFKLPGIHIPLADRGPRRLQLIGRDAADDTVRLARIVGDGLEVLRYERGGGVACVVERRVRVSQLAGVDPGPGRSWRFVETAETAAAPGGGLVALCDVQYNCKFSVDIQNGMTVESLQLQERYMNVDRVLQHELPWPPTIPKL